MLKNATLLCVTLAIAALALEGLLRMAGFTPHARQVNRFFVANVDTSWSVPDPDLGWINKEGTSVALGEGQASMTFWDFGRRASRADRTIPPGERIPVMILGGSDAQSYGVTDAESFAALLAEKHPELWIENFGTGAYGTVQSIMLAKRALEKFYPADRKPRLILLTLGDWHLARNVGDQSWIFQVTDPVGRYMIPPHYRQRGEELAFRPFRAVEFWPLESRSAAVNLLHSVWLKTTQNTMTEAVPVTRRLLADFADFAAKHGALLAVPVLVDDLLVTAPALEGQKFPHVDCSELGRTKREGYILAGSGHPNAKLHAHYAACLEEWLNKDVLPRLTAIRRDAPSP